MLLSLFEKTAPGEQCPGFIDDRGIRRAVFRGETGYRLRHGMPVNVDEYPLLPNVVTRPLCQDAWFATSAYIAGPGEMAYLEPLKDLYLEYGVKRPRLIPRMSLTLLDSWTRRQADKLELDIEDLLACGEDLAGRKLAQKLDGMDFREIGRLCEEKVERFLDGMIAIHPDFAELQNGLNREVKLLLGKIRKKSRERNTAELERLHKMFNRLLPGGRPQERVMNPFFYMNLYGGTDMMKYLLKHYQPDRKYLELS